MDQPGNSWDLLVNLMFTSQKLTEASNATNRRKFQRSLRSANQYLVYAKAYTSTSPESVRLGVNQLIRETNLLLSTSTKENLASQQRTVIVLERLLGILGNYVIRSSYMVPVSKSYSVTVEMIGYYKSVTTFPKGLGHWLRLFSCTDSCNDTNVRVTANSGFNTSNKIIWPSEGNGTAYVVYDFQFSFDIAENVDHFGIGLGGIDIIYPGTDITTNPNNKTGVFRDTHEFHNQSIHAGDYDLAIYTQNKFAADFKIKLDFLYIYIQANYT
ncbi:MAG: hypothetical protein ACYCQJ_14845 [Nitrososphaerales archaeon]